MTEPTTSDWVFGVKELNAMIQDSKNRMPDKFSPGDISDGYHTFNELYEHRIALFKALSRAIMDMGEAATVSRLVWKTKTYFNGSPVQDGWFLAGIGDIGDLQISYHIPISEWDTWPADIEHAPEFDGHTSADVLKRLGEL